MAKSKPSFNKKQLADKKRKKKKEKFARKMEKKETPAESNWENLIMYVDADGNFSKTPPIVEEPEEKEKKKPKTKATPEGEIAVIKKVGDIVKIKDPKKK